jgi:hypothetical protein
MGREPFKLPREGAGGARRIIFEMWPWFDVSSAVFESGLAREMSGADFKRYVTLRYVANNARSNVVQLSLAELEELDGISPRRAHEVNAHLEEMRMLEVERKANPYRYRMFVPSEWRLRRPGGPRAQPFPAPTSAEDLAWR